MLDHRMLKIRRLREKQNLLRLAVRSQRRRQSPQRRAQRRRSRPNHHLASVHVRSAISPATPAQDSKVPSTPAASREAPPYPLHPHADTQSSPPASPRSYTAPARAPPHPTPSTTALTHPR